MAVQVLAERGITLTEAYPKPLTNDVVHAADVIAPWAVAMPCPIIGKRYLDWDSADPNDQPIDRVRDIRDEPQARITALLRETSTSDNKELANGRQAVRSVRLCPSTPAAPDGRRTYCPHRRWHRIEVRSAGSEPAEQWNNPVAGASNGRGRHRHCRRATEDPDHRGGQSLRRRHHHGVRRCLSPIYPGKRYEDWVLDDPGRSRYRALSGRSVTKSGIGSNT